MRARALLALIAGAVVAAGGCLGPGDNQPPRATAHASLSEAAVGQEVIFTGAAVDSDGSVVSMAWDFDNDGVADFVNATRGAAGHTFATPGLFTAVFTATDNRGGKGSASVNVTITARFSINTDWGPDHAYLIQKAAALNASGVRVWVLPAGAASPTNFTVGAGLEVLNETSLRVSLPLSTLERYSNTRVQVYYNSTLGAERLINAVPFPGAEANTVTRHEASITETRPLGDSSLTLTYAGTVDMYVVGANVSVSFLGSGTSAGWSVEGGTNTSATYAFSRVAWNQSFGRYAPSQFTNDYAWEATGQVQAVSSSGFLSVVNLTTYQGARVAGNLTFERGAGGGYYVGDVADSVGSTAYALNSSGRAVAVDGNGVPTEVLRVLENMTMNGTIGGAGFQQTNLSNRWVAASDTFYHPDVSTAWNVTGHLGVLNLSDSGSRFLDADGNGAFNPDARPRFVSDGQSFVGLAPEELKEGDAFEVQNSGSASVRLIAGPAATEVLVATGFPTVAIEVVTVAGSVASPLDPGELPGSLSYRVVASGPNAGLRLSSTERLSYHGQSFEKALTLLGTVP